MRILFLTQILPYPPDAGPRVKTWHVLRMLSIQGHEVILASFVREEEHPHLSRVQQVCREVHAVPIHRTRFQDGGHWLRSQLRRRPFLVERDDVRGMRDVVGELMAEKSIDVIHADQLTMTQFALPWVRQGELLPWDIGNVERGARISPETPRPFLVFDAHNAVWTIVRRMSQTAPRLLRPILQLEARRIKHYEGWMVRSFDQTLAVSEPDRLTLLEASQAVGTRSNNGRGIQPGRRAPRISVVPIAVDTTQLERIPRPAGSTNILTMGTLHYPPNADGIRWFLTEVYPRILEAVPQATLTIVGRNPPEDFFKLARRFSDTVEVTGHVPDLEPYLKRAAVFVVPVRSGGGMRVRILEGFARAMPTITTSVGLEGIDAVPGADILVADNPDEFASHVVDVIRDPELQKSLAANGRRLVESRYDWRVALRALDGVYAVA